MYVVTGWTNAADSVQVSKKLSHNCHKLSHNQCYAFLHELDEVTFIKCSQCFVISSCAECKTAFCVTPTKKKSGMFTVFL